LNSLCRDTLGMGTMAEVFNGDVNDDWACIDESNVRAVKNGALVATVTFQGDIATLEIPDAMRLANLQHRPDFQPHEYGFGPQPMDWLKRKEPYVIDVPLPEHIPGLLAPQRDVPREQRIGAVGVRRML
jgi:hypothetical protein